MQHREIRLLTGLSVEERAKGDASAPMIVGYAAVFDTETDIGGMFCEKIMETIVYLKPFLVVGLQGSYPSLR